MKILKSFKDAEGVEIQLFLNNAGDPAIAAWDVDAGAAYYIVVYPDLERAEKEYAAALAAAESAGVLA